MAEAAVTASLARALDAFLQLPRGAAERHPHSCAAAQSLLTTMQDEGLVDDSMVLKRHGHFKLFTSQARKCTLQTIRRWKEKAQKLEADLKQERGEKRANLVDRMWFIRCGLGPPEVPPRVLESFVRDFGSDGSSQPISRGYISSVRDAFAEVLLRLNRQQIAKAGSTASCVLISHIHDEASMRLRSIKELQGSVKPRGMSTKVHLGPLLLQDIRHAMLLSTKGIQAFNLGSRVSFARSHIPLPGAEQCHEVHFYHCGHCGAHRRSAGAAAAHGQVCTVHHSLSAAGYG